MERRTFLKGASAAGLGTLVAGATNALTPAVSEALAPSVSIGDLGRLARRLDATPEPLATASNDLTPYAGTWTDTQLRHLLRRSMFGLSEAQLETARGLGSMSAVVNKLLTVGPLPNKPAGWVDELLVPIRGNAVDAQNKQRLGNMRNQELVNWWFDLLMKDDLSIREKMTLLWTNHFVIGTDAVPMTGYVYTYLQTCRKNALGNLKQFVSEITVDPAMLVYLNGNQNYVRNGKSYVNENYARELMELFTFGLIDPKTGDPNYTETDIQQAARALTGWQPSTTSPFVGVFHPELHDNTDKTFLGEKGNWAAQDIIDRIFRAGTPAGYNVAYFVSAKIYQMFVYYVPNPQVVDAMAQLMVQSNFEIAPVVRALISSAHFYDENVIGAMPKSPIDYVGSLVREFALTYPAYDPTDPPIKSTDGTGVNTYTDTNPTLSLLTTSIMTYSLGQELLNPPNVKGWPGGHNWISTGTFQLRETYSYAILVSNSSFNKGAYKLAFDPTRYATQIPNAVALKGDELAKKLEDLSLAFTLGPAESGDLSLLLHGAYPEPNYQFNAQGVNNFVLYLTNLPEFQLY